MQRREGALCLSWWSQESYRFGEAHGSSSTEDSHKAPHPLHLTPCPYRLRAVPFSDSVLKAPVQAGRPRRPPVVIKVFFFFFALQAPPKTQNIYYRIWCGAAAPCTSVLPPDG